MACCSTQDIEASEFWSGVFKSTRFDGHHTQRHCIGGEGCSPEDRSGRWNQLCSTVNWRACGCYRFSCWKNDGTRAHHAQVCASSCEPMLRAAVHLHDAADLLNARANATSHERDASPAAAAAGALQGGHAGVPGARAERSGAIVNIRQSHKMNKSQGRARKPRYHAQVKQQQKTQTGQTKTTGGKTHAGNSQMYIYYLKLVVQVVVVLVRLESTPETEL